MKWIACSERMPEPARRVLCSAEGTVWAAAIGAGGHWWFQGRMPTLMPTHWMPLPPPPTPGGPDGAEEA